MASGAGRDLNEILARAKLYTDFVEGTDTRQEPALAPGEQPPATPPAAKAQSNASPRDTAKAPR